MTISLRPYVLEGGGGRSTDAELGSLSVPMNRAEPGRGTVELQFVRLPATTPDAGPPIIFLNGGPGLSAIRAARGRLFALFDALRAAGDVILLDQRGAGSSTPTLQCLETNGTPLVGMEQLLTRDEAVRLAIDSVRRCVQRLSRAGVDVHAFHTNESADDVAHVARALNAPRVSVVAWSYGTHLAFAVMRRHPHLVARAVLAGPEGPDHTFKLPSRIEQYLAAIDARARAELPGTPELLVTMRRVLDAVEARPPIVTITHAGAAPVVARLSRFDLEWMTAEGIADVRVLARLPGWYTRMARGHFDGIARDPVLRAYYEVLRTDLAITMARVCMDCASGVSRERWQRIAREAPSTLLGRTVDFPLPEVCEAVGMPDLGDAFRAPLRSDTPALFVTGTLDARTPAENAHELMPGFANASHITVEDAGHTDLLHAPAVRAAVVRFLQGAAVEPARVPAEHPLRFEPIAPHGSTAA